MKVLKFLPLLLIFAGACKKKPPEPERICNDGVDNDENGSTDCDDPACASYPDCQIPEVERACADGIDDDQDGDIDCADPDCAMICKEKCDDEVDNDMDGDVDCDDSDCASTRVCNQPVQVVAANFMRVNFEFDSINLVGDSMSALRDNAKILQENGGVRVEIQGHADERGTTEYNLALGERRAKAIKDKLTGMGVSGSQLSIVSYGEERPAERGASESVWSVNRRAEFRVTAGGGDAVKGSVP